MDLTYAPEDVLFRDKCRAWLAANVPKGDLRTLDERKAWHRRLYEAGYVGMLWPKEYGGWGATPMQQAIVQDEMAQVSAPPAINGLGVGFIGPTIIVHGTTKQKERYLKKILTAEEIWCQLYSEPNAGSDLAGLKTRAEDAGDHWAVNGQKIWTSSGPIADWGILLARTDSKVAKHKGITCFLISMRQPGVEVRPLKQITGHSLFSEVFFTNARVEKDNIVGKLNGGWEIAQTTLGYERGGNSLGRVTRYAISYHQLVKAAKELKRNGRPLIQDPAVRGKLGRMFAELEVQRYAGLRVLSALANSDGPGPASSITKLSYTEFEKRFYETSLEILGPFGHGMTPESDFEEIDTSSGEPGTWATAYLWSRAGTIYSGSSEIQKNIIGERVLGLPKEVRADRMKA
jgi:alkylation response protein AidB-like acyl-CoA dehydrogenase